MKLVDNHIIKESNKHYKSREGILLNADLNGAFNIMRKIVPNVTVEGLYPAGKGFMFNPQRIDLLK